MLKLIFVFVLAATSSLLRFGKRGFGPMDFMMGEHSLMPDVSSCIFSQILVREKPCPSTTFRF